MVLFHVQDSDRPMWVVASDWQDALAQWKAQIALENDGDDAEPEGIQRICDGNDLLILGDIGERLNPPIAAANSETDTESGGDS